MHRFFACLLLFAPVAYAQDTHQIAAFQSGEFEQAASAQIDETSANALAFKARALLAKGICGSEQPAADLLTRAEAYARAALAIEEDHVEAKLQLAIALSLKARPLSTRAAMRTGYGEQAKKLAQTALKADPNNAYGHAFMAVWHVEVVRRGGSFGAGIMGASVKQSRKHYERAAALLPGDASLHWQYARALAALNPKKYRKDIDRALAKALGVSAKDHVERVMIARAAELRSRLQNQTRKAVKSWANSTL